MKKLLFIITTLMVISSCTTTREAKSSRIELRKEKNLAEQAVIRKAVESRRFIIKFNRLYLSRGGMVDLIPRTNYIVIDGEKAIISAAYLGRQYDIRPIAGISLTGKSMNYELTSDSSKDMYKIKMKVNKGGDTFDIYLAIGKNGTCNVSLSSMKIDFVRYSGQIVPIKDKVIIPFRKSNII